MEINVKRQSSSREKNAEIKHISDFLKSRYDFRYNEVLDRDEIRVKGESVYMPLTDQRLAVLELEAINAGMFQKQRIISLLVKSRTLAETYNPFKAYFDTIRGKWKEGDTDHIENLLGYITFKCYRNDAERRFAHEMFKKHLVRCVACVLRKIPFNKQCFVFQGGQSAGKSYFFRWLCPDELAGEYYKENPDLSHKDSTIALSENFMMNLDELDGMHKTEASRIKTLISQDNFKVRRNYGIRDEKMIRYASFFGSINDMEFLNDLTGNVRWLVFELLTIQHDNGGGKGYAARIDKNMVWAQALALAESDDYKCQLTKEEEMQVSQNNGKFIKLPAEVEIIERYFQPCQPGTDGEVLLTSTTVRDAIRDISKGANNFSTDRIGKAMAYLNFEKRSRKVNGNSPRYYYSAVSVKDEILQFLPETGYYLTTI
ncbi:VapE family protein [Ravibacter arvi]|uniref:VapE family protein n=1 Tax=Ravibacter arvi TaxID=2051041 RepID=A0ABP8MB56_9BACT